MPLWTLTYLDMAERLTMKLRSSLSRITVKKILVLCESMLIKYRTFLPFGECAALVKVIFIQFSFISLDGHTIMGTFC